MDQRTPCNSPWYLAMDSSAVGNKSVKDTVIITPAENPKEKVKNFSFFVLVKNTIMAPITVDNPAKVDKSRGIKEDLSII